MSIPNEQLINTIQNLAWLNKNRLLVFTPALEVYYDNTASLKAAEEAQARAELLAMMQQAHAAGDLGLLREATRLLTELIQPST